MEHCHMAWLPPAALTQLPTTTFPVPHHTRIIPCSLANMSTRRGWHVSFIPIIVFQNPRWRTRGIFQMLLCLLCAQQVGSDECWWSQVGRLGGGPSRSAYNRVNLAIKVWICRPQSWGTHVTTPLVSAFRLSPVSARFSGSPFSVFDLHLGL